MQQSSYVLAVLLMLLHADPELTDIANSVSLTLMDAISQISDASRRSSCFPRDTEGSQKMPHNFGSTHRSFLEVL